MITNKNGNLLEAKDIYYLCHGCNIHNTFGSGIAAQIRVKFPEAYQADCATKKGDLSKLGKISIGRITGHNNIKEIFNIYTQATMGGIGRHCSYDALVEGLIKVRSHLETLPKQQQILGIPYKIGSGLGGADWNVIEAIIKSIFENHPSINVIIYKFNP